jgi:hypothetical protein
VRHMYRHEVSVTPTGQRVAVVRRRRSGSLRGIAGDTDGERHRVNVRRPVWVPGGHGDKSA